MSWPRWDELGLHTRGDLLGNCMKIALWLLAAAVVVASIIAGHWMSLNKLLHFEVQQLEQRNATLESALANFSAQRCESHTPLAEQTLQELCLAYTDHFSAKELKSAKTRHEDSWAAERQSHVVRQKYRLLVAMLNPDPAEKEMLWGLLTEREAIVNAPLHSYFTASEDSHALVQEQQAALAEIDDRVSALLSKEDRQSYELMKESDLAQYQLQQLQQQFDENQKLSIDQQAQLLKMKLLSFQQLYGALESTAAEWQLESPDVKNQRLQEFVNQYKQGYFQEAAMLLSEPQLEKFKAAEEALFRDLIQSLAAQL